MTLSIDPDALDYEKSDHFKMFFYLVELIQDEIDDTTNEYFIQIRDSLLAAFRRCSQEIFFFNKPRIMTFETQTGKTWYGAKDGVFIGSDMVIETVFLEASDADQTYLSFQDPEILKIQFEESQKNSEPEKAQGNPIFYTYDDGEIGLFPTPKKVGIVRLLYFPDYLLEENAWKIDSPWMIYAFDLIKARTKYELYKNILKDPECAVVSFNDFQEQLQILHIETSRRKGCSRIRSVEF